MWKFNVISRCLSGPELRPTLTRLMNARWTATVTAEKEGTYFDDAALAAAKPWSDVPSITMFPFIGTAWALMPIIGRYDLQKLHLAAKEKRRKLGDIYREKFGPLNMVLSFNAEDHETLFKHEGAYPSRGEFQTMAKYRESRDHWYKSKGLLVLQGKEWWDLRSKTQRHLMKPKAIIAFLNPMQDVARDLVVKIHKVRDANKEVPNFIEELYKWSLESVALVGLDTRLGCLKLDLAPDSDGLRMINSVQTQFECMNKLEGAMGNLPWWRLFRTPTWKRFEAAADDFGEIAFKYINHALEDLKKTDIEDRDLTLLQSMLLTKDLDISGIMVTVADMLSAGIDTTSHTVGFFLYHMARNPEKQEFLYQEIRKVLPNKEDRITTDVYNELKYLKACIKESQRLLPIIGGTARSIDHDIVLSGYRIPAKTMIIIALQEMYTDEKYYSNPNKYLPERWFQKDEKYHPFAFQPFGVGTRSCIGRRLAELEIISLTTELIRNFKIEYHHEDIGILTRLINMPDKPMRFNFIER